MPNNIEITELTMVRRANVLQLMEDGGWDRKHFSDKVGVKYATLSGFLGPNPKSNVGQKTCELIEGHLNKSSGWLDKDRRGATDAGESSSASNHPPTPTVSLSAGTLVLKDHPINNFQRDAIIALLFSDD